MSTVSKDIADKIIAGKYPDDNWVKIVKYTNRWGGESYGCIHVGQSLDTYQPSDYVLNPTTYWEAKP